MGLASIFGPNHGCLALVTTNYMGQEAMALGVEQLLGSEDAANVLAIPLSRRIVRDKLVWHHIRSRVYLICSGYKCACDMKRNGKVRGIEKGECSNGVVVDPCWNTLWQMQVPPRVKSFLWKALHNILPTKDRPRRRGVRIDSEYYKATYTLRSPPATTEEGEGLNGGRFLGAKFIKLPNVSSPLMAEALAIRGALEFAYSNQWRKIVIESHSRHLIQVLNGRQAIPIEVEIVIDDIYCLA
ncbi:hypothetical protein LIER_32513 [Lithospermum erythrorhizon]|uniref:RNase H type-1 domain-containing protein n=1 Tax=Lithospermum erythrorhizon TaxID=34254 RepID=A0AAV3RXH5_LITER